MRHRPRGASGRIERHEAVLQAWKTFIGVLLFVATIVGTYLGAEAVDKTWVFWATVPVAAVATATRVLVPHPIEYLMRIRNYPVLLATSAAKQEEARSLAAALESAKRAADERYAAGVAEGQAQILGALAAHSAAATLLPKGLSAPDGQLLVFAEVTSGHLPPVGARYSWTVDVSGEIKGVLQVQSAEAATNVVILACVEETVGPFWRHLEEAAILRPDVPTGMTLTPLNIELSSRPNPREV